MVQGGGYLSSTGECFLASLEYDSLPYPCREGLFVNLTCGDREHRPFGIVNFGRIWLPSAVVEVDEHNKGRPKRRACCRRAVGDFELDRQHSTAALSMRSG